MFVVLVEGVTGLAMHVGLSIDVVAAEEVVERDVVHAEAGELLVEAVVSEQEVGMIAKVREKLSQRRAVPNLVLPLASPEIESSFLDEDFPARKVRNYLDDMFFLSCAQVGELISRVVAEDIEMRGDPHKVGDLGEVLEGVKGFAAEVGGGGRLENRLDSGLAVGDDVDGCVKGESVGFVEFVGKLAGVENAGNFTLEGGSGCTIESVKPGDDRAVRKFSMDATAYGTILKLRAIDIELGATLYVYAILYM